MEQKDARVLARRLTLSGIAAIADSRGGWSGQPASQVWGVRPAQDDGLTGNYEELDQMPERWRETLRAIDAMDAAAQAEAEHSDACKAIHCSACQRGAEATKAAFEAWQEVCRGNGV